ASTRVPARPSIACWAARWSSPACGCRDSSRRGGGCARQLVGVWSVRPADLAPAPLRHWRRSIDRRAGLRVDDRETPAPLEVTHERGAKLRIVGKPELVGRVEKERDPLAPLLLREMAIEMAANHVRVAAVRSRILGGAAQHFREERRDVLWMVRAHVRK